MGGFANTVFSILLGWLQTVAAMVWSALTHQEGSLFKWIGEHWIVLAVILCTVGLGADLAVYLFRWEPYKVWKSFFIRRRNRKDTTDPEPESDPGVYGSGRNTEPEPGRYFASAGETDPYGAAEETEAFDPDENIEEFQDYAGDPIYSAEPEHVQRSVPADSPYRRPVTALQGEPPETDTGSNTQRHLEKVMQPCRRRFRVSHLLGDGEEPRNGLYSPPQPVIDQQEAYHPPVYPRRWKDQDTKTNE